jgi:surface protein
MFRDCSSLTYIDLNNFNVDIVEDMESMFEGCSSLSVLDVSGFNTSNVRYMSSMFEGCSLLSVDVSGFDISTLLHAGDMMLSTSFGTSNYDTMLISWNSFGRSNVPFHAGDAKFSSGSPAIAKSDLLSRGWTITDGGAV